VVIPTRDRWPLLSRALASVFAQRVDLEVIVIDDGSTDGTQDRLASIVDERLRVLRNSSAHGVARARNSGIASARGEWIAFLDDDDLWAPSKLSVQLEAAGEGAEFVYAAAVVIDGEGAVKRVSLAPDPESLSVRLLESNAVGTPSSVLVRRDVLERVGGFDERLAVLADWDLWLRLVQSASVAAVSEALIAYVEHTENMTLNRLADIEAERRYMARKHRALCQASGVRFGGLDFSRWIVGQYRAHGLRLQAAREYARIGVRHGSLRDAARAGGLVLGERVMKLGPRQRPGEVVAPPDPPAWLEGALQAHV